MTDYRLNVIELLGNRCIMGCNFLPRVLDVDHKNGDGALDRARFNYDDNAMWLYYLQHPEEARIRLQPLCPTHHREKSILAGDLSWRGNALLLGQPLSSGIDIKGFVYDLYQSGRHQQVLADMVWYLSRTRQQDVNEDRLVHELIKRGFFDSDFKCRIALRLAIENKFLIRTDAGLLQLASRTKGKIAKALRIIDIIPDHVEVAQSDSPLHVTESDADISDDLKL